MWLRASISIVAAEGKTETSSPRRAGTASVGGDQVNAHPVAAKEAAVAPISMPVEKTTVPRGATTDGGALADLARMLPDDARAAWSAQPAIPVRLLDSHVNLMVLGESGLGKTTFIRNLVASFSATTKPHDGTSTSLADFMANPQKLTTRLAPMDIVKAGRRLHLSVQDAPGWGDEVHTSRYLRTMMAHLLEARQRVRLCRCELYEQAGKGTTTSMFLNHFPVTSSKEQLCLPTAPVISLPWQSGVAQS